MSEKIVIPHEYLPALRRMREGSIIPSDLTKVDEFIAAAEADRPPLPEDWVLLSLADGAQRVLWHRDGHLYISDRADREDYYGSAVDRRDCLTPLRPTVTEADVEKAARAARAYFEGSDTWDTEPRYIRDPWMNTVRATLDALGIEVQP